MESADTIKFTEEDCIEMMQESLHDMTPNYADFDIVVESLPFQDAPSLSVELPSLLDDSSTASNESGLFCMNHEILHQLDDFTQRELNSETSVLQPESSATNSNIEQPKNNCVVDSPCSHHLKYHLHHKHYLPSYPYYPYYCREYVCQVDRQVSELSDRCSRLEQLIATQQAELTEIKKRCAVLEHENAEYKKKTI